MLGMLITVSCCFIFKQKRKIELSGESIGYLKELKINDFDVTYKNERENEREEVKSVVRKQIIVTDTEVKEYIKDELSLAGDFIEISCDVFVEGKLVNELKQEVLKVGAGYYGKEFEEKLIGIPKNKKIKIEITVPKYEEKYGGLKHDQSAVEYRFYRSSGGHYRRRRNYLRNDGPCICSGRGESCGAGSE